MDKRIIFYIMLAVVFLLLVGTLLFSVFGTSKEEKILALLNVFNNNQEDFTDIAKSYVNDYHSLHEFCRLEDDMYKISGFWFNSKSKKITSNPAPAGGEEIDYEEFLQRLRITDEKFNYYINFLNKLNIVKCIEGDVNFKMSNEAAIFIKPSYYPDRDGLVYITDGSVTDNVNKQYLEQNFKEFTKIDDTNWYIYETVR